MLSITACTSDDIMNSDKTLQNQSSESTNDAFAKAQLLFNSFKPKVTRSEVSTPSEYPENFGGCYIDETGILKILIKEYTNNEISTYTSTIGTNGVVYEECMYSRNELMNLKKQIAEYIISNENSSISQNIDFVAFSCKKNRVVVGLKNMSESNISTFKREILDAPSLEFVYSNTTNIEQGDLASGQGIVGNYVTNGRNSGSVGYKAEGSGYTGFVTAAHVVDTGNTISLATNWSTNVATCEKGMHQGTVDAAFCKMSSGWNMLLAVYGVTYNPINPFEGTTVEGSWVKKYGANGYSEGYVINDSYDTWVNSVYMMDLAQTTYGSTGGDSGGLILSQDNGYIMGIHQSGGSAGGNYCKVGNINYMLGLTLATW